MFAIASSYPHGYIYLYNIEFVNIYQWVKLKPIKRPVKNNQILILLIL